MAAKLAVWLKPVSDALGVIYIPAMWVLLVFHALLGLAGLLSADMSKGQVRALHGNGRMRLFGLYLVVVGILVFSQASLFANPGIHQAVSVVVFLVGGVLLMIPAVGVILVEWMLDKGPGFFRVVALVNIVIAGLFYAATWTNDEIPQPQADSELDLRNGEPSRADDADEAAANDEVVTSPATPEPSDASTAAPGEKAAPAATPDADDAGGEDRRR